MPDCRYCGKYYHRLGIMRHEAMHRDRLAEAEEKKKLTEEK